MKPFLRWFSNLFKLGLKPGTRETKQEPVRWLRPEENPFDIEILDCRPVALGMVSFTSDFKVAARFAELRSSRGEELRGTKPPDTRTVACKLVYPHEGTPSDGPKCKAQVMEDRWDIYLYDGHLYFARSWTGELVYRVKIEFTGQKATVSSVETTQAEDDELAVRTVDYLIKSHLYCLQVPHPLPREGKKEAQWLAMYSFSQFGRRGLYGTFADTVGIGLAERGRN